METKELKIQVPEGYEIDKENSTFECIKFKPIKKAVTYDDVVNSVCANQPYISYIKGEIIAGLEKVKQISLKEGDEPIDLLVSCHSPMQIAKILSIAKLMNVAKYLNGKDWKPDWDNSEEGKYYIYCQNGSFKIDYVYSYIYFTIYFKSEEAAQQAIDILGEETIRLALSTDW